MYSNHMILPIDSIFALYQLVRVRRFSEKNLSLSFCVCGKNNRLEVLLACECKWVWENALQLTLSAAIWASKRDIHVLYMNVSKTKLSNKKGGGEILKKDLKLKIYVRHLDLCLLRRLKRCQYEMFLPFEQKNYWILVTVTQCVVLWLFFFIKFAWSPSIPPMLRVRSLECFNSLTPPP